MARPVPKDPIARGRAAGRRAWEPLILRVLSVAALAIPACAHVPASLERAEALETAVGVFRIEYDPDQAADAAMARGALENAVPRLLRWGRLRAPVTLRVLPSHRALEAEAGRRGYGWLRAWARPEVVLLQAPRSWGLGSRPQQQLDELLVHELTHSLMFQLASVSTPAERGRLRGIPFWFLEGMASVTASQDYRRGSLQQLRQSLLASDPDGSSDALEGGERLTRDRRDEAYAAAHHAFAFLLQRYGDEAVVRTLAGIRQGATFGAAFQQTIGIEPRAFLREFRRYVVMEGWRSWQR